MNLEDFFKRQLGTWFDFYKPIMGTDYIKKLVSYLVQNKSNLVPAPEYIFRCYRLCDMYDVRVVILGIEPYPFKNISNGLAFGSLGIMTDELRYIKEELSHDYDTNIFNAELDHWAKQGVLLLNASLTTTEGQTGSHTTMWKPWIEYTYRKFSTSKMMDVVFLHWGIEAQTIGRMVRNKWIINGPHPAGQKFTDLGFIGSGCFTQINQMIKTPIEWTKT